MGVWERGRERKSRCTGSVILLSYINHSDMLEVRREGGGERGERERERATVLAQ